MAKSKVKKGFFYYLFVFLGFVFGVFCILATILVFNPGQDIYGIGIRYVSYGTASKYYYLTNDNETKIEYTNFNKVKFNSDYANFKISYNHNEVITLVEMSPSIAALSQSEDTDLKLYVTVSNGTLNIDIDEPELWIGFSNKIDVELVLPREKNFTDIDFEINTKSGNVTIGDQTSKEYELNSLKINTESGTVKLSKNLNVKTEEVFINSKNSKISITTDIKKSLNITNESGRIIINEMSGDLYVQNKGTLELNAEKIGGDVFVESTNGYANIKELGTTYVNHATHGTRVELGYYEVNNTGKLPADHETILHYEKGSFVSQLNLDNTNVIIGKMTGDADIENKTGSITIQKLGKKADIITTSGSIEINDAYNNIDAKTTSGQIIITQNSNLAKSILISDVGKITANITDLGAIEMTTKGNIDVNVKTGLPFKFVYNAKQIDVSWVTTQMPLSGFLLVSGAQQSTTCIVTANSENGTVTLTDRFEVNNKN